MSSARPDATGGGAAGGADGVELYRAVRAHEVMLNDATAAQERSVIAPLLTLNGGAAAAFATLLGAKGPLQLDLGWARAAVLAWMLGLLLAAGAGWAAARRQALLNKAHRLLREQVELALFADLATVVAVPEPDEGRTAARTAARTESNVWSRVHTALRATSAVTFVVGGVLALASA